MSPTSHRLAFFRFHPKEVVLIRGKFHYQHHTALTYKN